MGPDFYHATRHDRFQTLSFETGLCDEIPMAYQTLELQEDPSGVLTVSLNRPDIRNAFNEVLIHELTEVFSKDARKPEVRVVVLRGKGPVFCAGGDLNWMKKAVNFSKDENMADTNTLTQRVALLNDFPKPIIGAIQGAAIGGGVGLVSICDYAIAQADTVFSLSEV